MGNNYPLGSSKTFSPTDIKEALNLFINPANGLNLALLIEEPVTAMSCRKGSLAKEERIA